MEWQWDYLHNMKAAVNGSYSYANETKDLSTKVFMWSPNKNFDFLAIGSDIYFMKNNWW